MTSSALPLGSSTVEYDFYTQVGSDSETDRIFETLYRCFDLSRDADLAKLLGVTAANICQARRRGGRLSCRMHLTIMGLIGYLGCSDFIAAASSSELDRLSFERLGDNPFEAGEVAEMTSMQRTLWRLESRPEYAAKSKFAAKLGIPVRTLADIRAGRRGMPLKSRAILWAILSGHDSAGMAHMMSSTMSLIIAIESWHAALA